MSTATELPPPPTWIPFEPEGIPDELKNLRHWVKTEPTWREKEQKYTKPPLRADGSPASSTDSDTWDTLDNILKSCGPHQRPGFMLQGSPVVGIDIDHCRNPITGEVARWALDIVEMIDSYTELSVSGTGIHILVKAYLLDRDDPDSWNQIDLPVDEFPPADGAECAKLEVYKNGRYFVTTGHCNRRRVVQ